MPYQSNGSGRLTSARLSKHLHRSGKADARAAFPAVVLV